MNSTTTLTPSSPLEAINGLLIVRVPQAVSDGFSSRGIVMVDGELNGVPFRTVLEPDGKGGHWFSPDATLLAQTGLKPGDPIDLRVEPSKDWIEVAIPSDVQTALDANPAAKATWLKTTAMARWEWIRWIRATNNAQTRARHIEVACSKLQSGMRRPCCFNARGCTVPEVSKNGVLIAS